MSSGTWLLQNYEKVICSFLCTCYLFIVLNIFRKKLIEHDAGEAGDPSRKMRLEKCCRNLPELLIVSFFGSVYGNFIEKFQYWQCLQVNSGKYTGQTNAIVAFTCKT